MRGALIGGATLGGFLVLWEAGFALQGGVETGARQVRAGSLLAVVAVIGLGLLAIACMAFDAGMPIEVASEYLPKALLQRLWVGEYAT